MRVLVGCEESQEVCKAFRERGHEAYSCDLQECSGGHPEWHIMADILTVVNGGTFITQAGTIVYIEKWDLGIFHPPCQYLTVTANRSHKNNPQREEKRRAAFKFFMALINAPINKICVENPKGVISTLWRKPDQYIQPYHHGHHESKKTGLWLKNLPWLYPTKKVMPEWIISKSGDRYSQTHWKNPSTNNPEGSRLRSKTFPGIAGAMAQQWG